MKKTICALLTAVTFLVGCQDEKPAEATATETPIIEDNQLVEVSDAMLVPEKQAADGQGISTETFVDNEHNENNALDWSGTYLGTIPCADCPGIDISITLNQDGTYKLEQTYQDRDTAPLTSEGQFIWNESKDTITLTNEQVPNQYFVGEDVLMKLDMHGEIVTGELSANYNLFKEE
ncbi:copper resistance protein NlpE N-terminal domain-containing protein [Vibrio alginolyticus]|nr:copper resistance protein NlpE N-terminal domain-containing protein [Vibrio alginolyticus]